MGFAAHGDVSDLKRTQAGAVVLARSDDFADALGGSALAVRKNAPLLITPTGQLDRDTTRGVPRLIEAPYERPGPTVHALSGS